MAAPLQSVTRGTLHRPTLPSFLLPFLQHSTQRHASILNSLSNVRSSYSHRKRVGRGPSSGKGKTAGRGEGGQKKKSGTPFVHSLGRHFEGGQTPVEIVKGKRGFHQFFHKNLQLVNLSKLSDWIRQGRIDPTRPITPRELYQSRCINTPKDGIKLLANGKETLPADTPLKILVSRASASAIAAVEAAGGQIQTRYYTHFALRQLVRGKMDPVHSLQSRFDEKEWGPRRKLGDGYRLPDPLSRKDREYYRDPAKRGYLNYTILEGEGPSLYHKPLSATMRDKMGNEAKRAKSKEAANNRIW